jgi:hypothetical protein
MLLLVVGLVVIVLVILVVVFLSVRSTRAEEGADAPARPAGRGPAARRRRPADDEWLDDEAGFDEPEDAEPAYSQPRPLPRPRGHQHDEDPGDGDEPVNRNDIRRRQASRPRLSGTTRDRSGADWPAGDWGGVSDEQYWAELAADKPLATTARSAQPGTDARQAAAARSGSTDPVPADMGGRGSRRASSPSGPRPGQARTVAAATAATAQFSFGSADEPAAGQPWAAEPEPATFGEPATASGPTADGPAWASPVTSAEGGWETGSDPGGITDWSGTQGDGGAETATWSAEDSWGAPVPAAQDTRSWAAEDPLTSPSFSAQSAHAADSRSYRGSTERARAGGGEVAGHAYQPEPAWDDRQAGSYAGQPDGWTQPGHEFPGGTLEPLPGAAADDAAEPVSSWYSAPTPVTEAPSSYPRDPYPGAEHQGWQPAAQDYGEAASYGSGHEPQGYGSGDAGYPQAGYEHPGTQYSLPGHGTSDSGYRSDSASYDEPAHGHGYGHAGYGEPEYGSSPGYGQPDHESAGNGYGQPDHESAGNGYGQPDHEPGGGSYSQSGHDPVGNGGYQPGYDAGAGYDSASGAASAEPGYGAGYEGPGYAPGEPGYGQPGFNGGPGHGTGYGHSPDYTRGQR